MSQVEDNNQENEVQTSEVISIESSLDNTNDNADEKPQEQAHKDTLILDDNGQIIWNEVVIARLIPNQPHLEPKFELLGDELNQPETKSIINEKLDIWLKETLGKELFPLLKLKRAVDFIEPQFDNVATETITEPEIEPEILDKEIIKPTKKITQQALTPEEKSLAQKILDNHGIIDRDFVHQEVSKLAQENRRVLRALGIRFGRVAIYIPTLLKPKSARLNAVLGYFAMGANPDKKPYLPPVGLTSYELSESIDDVDLSLVGFKNVAGRAIRIDILDRVHDALYEAQKEAKGAIIMPLAVVSLLGVSNETAEKVLDGLGWQKETDEEGVVKWRIPRPKRQFIPRNNETEARAPYNANNAPRKEFKSGNRPENSKYSGKNRKENGSKPRAPQNYSSAPSKDSSESPFAILAKLKPNL